MVQCVAIVMKPKPLTEAEKEWVAYANDREEECVGVATQWNYTVCVLRLVEAGKRPKWVVERTVYHIANEYEVYGLDSADALLSIALKEHPQIKPLCYEHEMGYPCLGIVKDMRVQLNQIHQLFPETERMPYAIACEYVRDLM